MKEEQNKRMDRRLRCGLCGKVVREKTWEEHTQSDEHQWRLGMLQDVVREHDAKYPKFVRTFPFGRDEVNEVRKRATSKEVVSFT